MTHNQQICHICIVVALVSDESAYNSEHCRVIHPQQLMNTAGNSCITYNKYAHMHDTKHGKKHLYPHKSSMLR